MAVALLSTQAVLALGLLIGYHTQFCSVASWFLYLSLTLRNTWLAYILDRYFHYLLFYSMFLPIGHVWSIDHIQKVDKLQQKIRDDKPFLNIATIAFKLQICWIYIDAGMGKLLDPKGGWSWAADPLPALDTYARHTVAARYMYTLLGPLCLRFLTPIVVWVELLAAPMCLLGALLECRTLQMVSIGCICLLHIGIALTLRNTVLLSLVACSAWALFLPKDNILFWIIDKVSSVMKNSYITKKGTSRFMVGFRNSVVHSASLKSKIDQVQIYSLSFFLSKLIVILFIFGSLWFETTSNECNQSTRHIWSTLLHNRWNVFTGAEEYVTWEIAPGRLANGAVVDVWAMSETVKWEMPTETTEARKGRWRSFPYLSGVKGEEGKALWGYLCRQWDREMHADEFPGNKLLRYNFFMLQADVLPDMHFSATRKRLIHSQNCEKLGETKTISTLDSTDEL